MILTLKTFCRACSSLSCNSGKVIRSVSSDISELPSLALELSSLELSSEEASKIGGRAATLWPV